MKKSILNIKENNYQSIIIIISKNSGKEIKVMPDIENYVLNHINKIFMMKKIYDVIINEIFVELIFLILKKKGNIGIVDEFHLNLI